VRRSEREITSREEIDAIIRQCHVCRLGLCEDGQPYVLPMSFGYDGRSVFLHCASQGRKLDVLTRNPHVCVEFDLDDGLVRGDTACDWSQQYRSVLALGIAHRLAAREEKVAALVCLMAQYTDEPCSLPVDAVDRTVVLRVDITTITGKRSATSS
jgi:uncharacterized protein